ncbi:MAG: high-potential iron-sulfur protein [Bradymonadaceae bacterium]
MDDEDALDRRQFLKRASMIGAAMVGGGTVVAACDKKKKTGGSKPGPSAGTEKPSGGGKKPESGGAKEKQGGGKLNCENPEGLSKAKMKTRKNLKYVDKSPKKGKNCLNCNFYVKPKKKGECGSCKVVPGPVHPEGYCTSWAKKS